MIDEIQIRWMIRRDMPQVLRIDRESFVKPWDEDDLVRLLRQRRTIGMVATSVLHDRIYGFMVYTVSGNDLVLERLAVDPAMRFQGVGRVLIDKLRSKLAHQRRDKIVHFVHEENLAAQLFFRACGGRCERIVRVRNADDSVVTTYLFWIRVREPEGAAT